MNKLFLAIRNIFSTPDLRNRVLFTLGMLAVYRLGGHIPTPGINTALLQDMFQRGQPAPPDNFCAGHHAIHHGVDYFAIDGGGMALPGTVAERRRAGAAEDHAVHALFDDYSELVSIVHDREDLDDAEHEWRSAGVSPRCAFHADDHADADDRLGVHHVAGRADQRARHRQRDVADYFRRHCGGIAECGARSVLEDD